MDKTVFAARLVVKSTPDDLKNELQQIGESMSGAKWRVGDIVNHISYMIKVQGIYYYDEPISMNSVVLAVQIMLRRELSLRTIQYYATIAAFYPVSVREKYDPPLTFSHFDYARRAFDGTKWEEVLDLALQMMDEYGVPPSVGVLRSKIEGIYQEQSIIQAPSIEDDQDLFYLEQGNIFDHMMGGDMITASAGRLGRAIKDFSYYADKLVYDQNDLKELRGHLQGANEIIEKYSVRTRVDKLPSRQDQVQQINDTLIEILG